ncbi:hypothetical protein HF324_28095 [Chitinophaga oryzae]|uniref:Uncharacterized protein n=1 Tax=Chitinophaga oryzae TaxID=2725414 RepID=A0ABX6LMX7_9BACT|nr:hypothetical protein [Chitinophaga oryzae]QJB41496.1 hypothetical protein HF324_28095 [Chitinophaga oryzae]
MNKHEHISNELKQLAPDANWPADAPYTVPAGYFDRLPDAVLQQVHLLQPGHIDAPTSHRPFTVPTGYFEELPQAILQRVHAARENPVHAELKEISPLLAAIPKQVPFTVPTGYFGALATIPPVPVTPSLRAVHRNPVKKWLKYAVAACLITFTSTTAILFLQRDSNFNVEKQLERIDTQDIEYYLQNHTDALDNDAIFAGFADDAAPESLQQQLNEEIPPAAIEQYLQLSSFKEVLPNQ